MVVALLQLAHGLEKPRLLLVAAGLFGVFEQNVPRLLHSLGGQAIEDPNGLVAKTGIEIHSVRPAGAPECNRCGGIR